LTLLLLGWAYVYLDQYGGGFDPLVYNRRERLADVEARVPKLNADALLLRGRQVYNTYCSGCHQPNGLGVLAKFPPLVTSEWVLTPGPNRLIRIVLNGLQGPITVKDLPYNTLMLPWRDQLTDTDIAAVLTFIRLNPEWGHAASPVTPAQIKAIRELTATRGNTAWKAPELLALPDAN
jgi:mono/diheme cytochrome c family protein